MGYTSFSDLRKNRGDLKKLTEEVEKIANPNKSYEDNRQWQPTLDKAGNGSAIIRFLPPPKGEELPWVRVWSHGFQGPTGKWYIENSLTTLGQSDPVSELNSELWNAGSEAKKEIARKQKRKLNYYSNILVINDPKHPENNGKVFLFRYGKKVFDKIKDLMQPQFEDEDPVNPFDMWAGANFRLKIRKVDGYNNYDKSEFESPSAIEGTDEELQAIWEQEYSLAEFLDPKNFKSYEDLKKRLDFVLGTNGARISSAEKMQLEEEQEEAEEPKKAEAPKRREVKVESEETEEEDDVLSYFKRLAEEDDD
jgi:hypothetical protein